MTYHAEIIFSISLYRRSHDRHRLGYGAIMARLFVRKLKLFKLTHLCLLKRPVVPTGAQVSIRPKWLTQHSERGCAARPCGVAFMAQPVGQIA
jgi:hypothetical protein